MTNIEPTPWRSWLGAAIAGLGMSPSEFWRLSLREWRLLTWTAPPESMTRAELDALAARCPDGVT